jgi:methyltransferase family protein
LEIFNDSAWQMTFGERAALEGVLAQRKPELAIDIGTAGGASLRRIAAHAGEVHSIDLTPPPGSIAEMPNVKIHTGDSHQLLPGLLQGFAEEGRNVDLVLVDGDHSPGGVRRDLDDLLSSPALADTIILIHNTANEQVRAGADAVRYAAYPKVAHVNLEFVPGYMFREPARAHELSGGFGLVMVDAARTAYFPATPVIENRYYEVGHLYPQIRDFVAARERGRPTSVVEERDRSKLIGELAAARSERDHYKDLSESLISSPSWKLTAPLRAARSGLSRAKNGT